MCPFGFPPYFHINIRRTVVCCCLPNLSDGVMLYMHTTVDVYRVFLSTDPIQWCDGVHAHDRGCLSCVPVYRPYPMV